MRHQVGKKKLNRTRSHRSALISSMCNSLILHEQIKTTLVKAKFIRPYVEKLITKAKNKEKSGNVTTIRYLLSKLQNNTPNKTVVNKLMHVISNRYKSRNGGYTRIIKAGHRYGDNAPMAYIELLDWEKDKNFINQKLMEEKERKLKETAKKENNQEQPQTEEVNNG